MQMYMYTKTSGQSNLTKAAPNDPAYTARAAADLSCVRDWQTDWLTETANIGKNSQHLLHSMQPNEISSLCIRELQPNRTGSYRDMVTAIREKANSTKCIMRKKRLNSDIFSCA